MEMYQYNIDIVIWSINLDLGCHDGHCEDLLCKTLCHSPIHKVRSDKYDKKIDTTLLPKSSIWSGSQEMIILASHINWKDETANLALSKKVTI